MILFIEDVAKTLLILIVLGKSTIIKIKVKKITINIKKLFDLMLNIITKGIIFWVGWVKALPELCLLFIDK